MTPRPLSLAAALAMLVGLALPAAAQPSPYPGVFMGGSPGPAQNISPPPPPPPTIVNPNAQGLPVPAGVAPMMEYRNRRPLLRQPVAGSSGLRATYRVRHGAPRRLRHHRRH